MKNNLLLLAMILIFSSCESQLGTAISSTFSNIVSGDAFTGSSGDEAYAKLKEAYKQKPANLSMNPTCNSLESLVPILNSDSKNLSGIKDQLCSCQAWGTCDSKSCGCDVLCPKDFGIFKKLEKGDIDSEDNTLAFSNSDNRFAKNDMTYQGYCWGISLITQKFNRLATFSPEEPKRFTGIENETNRLNEYKSIIARINNNEPVTIPGFKSLYAFSADPEVRNLLEDSAKEEWSKNAMTSQGLGMVASVATPPKNEMDAMFDDIEFRLKNNMSPSIVYNKKDSRTEAHVLLVSGSGVNPNTNERYLCLRDNNFNPYVSMNCNIKMILKKDGTVMRQLGLSSTTNPGLGLDEVGKVALTHSENTNTMEQVNNLHTKCSGEKGCSKI